MNKLVCGAYLVTLVACTDNSTTPQPNLETEANGLGMVLARAPGDAQWKIADVVPNSPAYRSGLRAGDVVRSINNLNLDSIEANSRFSQVRDVLAGDTNFSIEVDQGNGGRSLSIDSMPLNDLFQTELGTVRR